MHYNKNFLGGAGTIAQPVNACCVRMRNSIWNLVPMLKKKRGFWVVSSNNPDIPVLERQK